jgi:hypothetical protein
MAISKDALGNYAGWDEDEARIWHSYMYWALKLAQAGKHRPLLICARDEHRLCIEQENALALICLSGFVLEYRMKRVLKEKGKRKAQSCMLGQLLGLAKDREGKPKPDFWELLGKGSPEAWPADLAEICRIRNKIAHGKWAQLAKYIKDKGVALPTIAKRLYNSMIKAMALMNVATGYGAKEFQKQECMQLVVSLTDEPKQGNE